MELIYKLWKIKKLLKIFTGTFKLTVFSHQTLSFESRCQDFLFIFYFFRYSTRIHTGKLETSFTLVFYTSFLSESYMKDMEKRPRPSLPPHLFAEGAHKHGNLECKKTLAGLRKFKNFAHSFNHKYRSLECLQWLAIDKSHSNCLLTS